MGFGLSVLFVMWFLSGFVMMYASFPTMTHHQRLQQLPAVDLRNCRISLPEAARRAGIAMDTLQSVRVGMLLDRPVYRMATKQNRHVAVFADNGAVLRYTDTTLARKIATTFVHHTSQPQQVETLTQIDQWMAAHKYQGYLPHVHRFRMNDAASTYVYVSVYTGEVVQMLNARQRFLAWLGPIPHWIYPTVLIRNRPVWSQVVIWLSVLGTVMCVTGMVMGVIRFKRKKSSDWAFSPYKKKWFRWHHYTGFIFGLFVFTWILSGLFSMSPLDWAPSTKLSSGEGIRWSGEPLNLTAFALSPAQAAPVLAPYLDVKEIHLQQVNGKPYYVAYQDEQQTRLLAADARNSQPSGLLPVREALAGVRQLNPAMEINESRVLTFYDDYYYAKHRDKRLPVLRVKMDDARQTWYYVDLKTGQVALKHQSLSRAERWLYHGLHSLDFRFILYKRPWWDVVVIFLLTGGLLASGSGLVLTWKWLKRKKRRKPVETSVFEQAK